MVKNAITVFARVKPENSQKGIANYKIHRRPRKHPNEDFLVLTAPSRSSEYYIDNRPESWNFSFHRIFSHDASQDDIFEIVARPIVDSVFDGYNATIFAYGQTGSGKTYTITGEPGVHVERGILPRTLQYIFDTVRKNPENLYSVEVAYLEIYNENGYDLLLERKQREAATRLEDLPRVTIQEDENGTMHLKNLSFRIVENESEALQFLMEGDNYRAISETPMNPRSSRSHCIFTIVVSVKKFGSERYSSAKMHLVDLAGSERVYKCAIEGAILNEAKHINLSLHFLEQVIVCLGQENLSHVPYRNSLLTSILRDSLGGNCLTTMLANLSVSNFNLEETVSTCRFAQRVALVRNDVNLTFVLDTRSENKLLRLENERLRRQIEDLKKNNITDSRCTNNPDGNFEYYKNLVIQRDQEISRLIDILKKERSRREILVREAAPSTNEILHHEKLTQMPSSRVDPEKQNSFTQTSPRTSELISSRLERKIKTPIGSPKPRVPTVPALNLANYDFETEKAENFFSLEKNRETSRVDDDAREIVRNKIAIELFENKDRSNESARLTKINDKLDENSRVENSVVVQNCPRENSPGFLKKIKSATTISCGETEDSRFNSRSETPKSGFTTPNILRNILKLGKSVAGESRIGMDEISSRTRNDNVDIDKNFEKLPLTGDPEIDEEIIAFYRAKREGGSY